MDRPESPPSDGFFITLEEIDSGDHHPTRAEDVEEDAGEEDGGLLADGVGDAPPMEVPEHGALEEPGQDPGEDGGESGSSSAGDDHVEEDDLFPPYIDSSLESLTLDEYDGMAVESARQRAYRSCCYVILNRIRKLRTLAAEGDFGLSVEEQLRKDQVQFENEVLLEWETSRVSFNRRLAGLLIAASCREPDQYMNPQRWYGETHVPSPVTLARDVWHFEWRRNAYLSVAVYGDRAPCWLRWREEYPGQYEEYLGLVGILPGQPGLRRMGVGPQDDLKFVYCL